MNTSQFKTLTLRPMLGPLDCRSAPDDVPANSFRMKLNMAVTEDRKLCRRPGHRRLMATRGNINWDLHDQGYCNSTQPDREQFTLLREILDTNGTRRLLAGKRDQLFVLATNAGTWLPLMQTGIFGGDSTSSARWQVGVLGNYAVFNNDFDSPRYYRIGRQPTSCGETLIDPIPELRDTIKLTRATWLSTFNGCVFLLGTTENGTRYPTRVRWSGLNSVTAWTATLNAQGVASNISGYQDLPYGDPILAAVELQGNLYIFTEGAIWRCYVEGGTAVFGFVQVYSEKRNRDRCLRYPYTLVSDGNDAYYFGQDGIYRYNPYGPIPERDDWLHRATGLMFEELDPACCAGPTGEYLPDEKEIWWSYTRPGESCANSRTFVANTMQRTADYVDTGYSAFANWRPDERQTLGEWLDQFCAEGEDFAAMCATLGNRVADDFCNECNSTQLFVGASTDDLCLKEIGTAYSRERCTNAATGRGQIGGDGTYVPFTATYTLDGYFSLLRGILPLGSMEENKVVRRFLVENSAAFSLDTTPEVRLRFGTSYKALDPNTPGYPFAFAYTFENDLAPACAPFYTTDGNACEVLWDDAGDDQALSCPDTEDAQERKRTNTELGLGMEWALHEEGRFLFWELVVIGKDDSGDVVPPTGGAACFSRVEVEARKA